MTLLYAAQKGISDFSFIIGTGLKYGGAFALVAMAVVGTVSVDIVLLAAAEKQHNAFLTGFVLASMFSRDVPDPIPLLIASPITSIIAVALSFALGVPGVGVAILLGWTVAAGILAIGLGLEALGKAIEPGSEPEFAPSMSY